MINRTSQIPHKWIYDSENGFYDFNSYNMSYNGNRLYSYSSILATIDREKKIVKIDRRIANYSNTSRRHHRYLLNAIPSDYTVFTNPGPDLEPLDGYLEEILTLLDKSTRARTTDYVTPAIKLINEAMQYINSYKLDGRGTAYKELVILSKQKDSLAEQAKDITVKYNKQKAKEKAKYDRERQKARQSTLNRFLGTNTVKFDPNYNSVYLKVNDGTIKTSNGLTVPLRESLLMYKRFLANKPILGLKLSNYTVLKVSKESVTLGCTTISAKELKRALNDEL